jgi:hypothetical protein
MSGVLALGDNVELALYDGRHVFTSLMLERAYQFLKKGLSAPTSARRVRAVPLDDRLLVTTWVFSLQDLSPCSGRVVRAKDR